MSASRFKGRYENLKAEFIALRRAMKRAKTLDVAEVVVKLDEQTARAEAAEAKLKRTVEGQAALIARSDLVKRLEVELDEARAKIEELRVTIEEVIAASEDAFELREGEHAAEIERLQAQRGMDGELIDGATAHIYGLRRDLASPEERAELLPEEVDLLVDLEQVCAMAKRSAELEGELNAAIWAGEQKDHSLKRVSAENTKLRGEVEPMRAELEGARVKIAELEALGRGQIHRAALISWALREVRGIARLFRDAQDKLQDAKTRAKKDRQASGRAFRFFESFLERFMRIQGMDHGPFDVRVMHLAQHESVEDLASWVVHLLEKERVIAAQRHAAAEDIDALSPEAQERLSVLIEAANIASMPRVEVEREGAPGVADESPRAEAPAGNNDDCDGPSDEGLDDARSCASCGLFTPNSDCDGPSDEGACGLDGAPMPCAACCDVWRPRVEAPADNDCDGDEGE